VRSSGDPTVSPPGSPPWPAWLSQAPDGVRLQVLAQPRASRTRVAGEHDGRLRIQLAAPPADGEANAVLVEFLAAALGVRKGDVVLEHGATGRRKTVRVRGATAEAAAALLPGPAPGG